MDNLDSRSMIAMPKTHIGGHKEARACPKWMGNLDSICYKYNGGCFQNDDSKVNFLEEASVIEELVHVPRIMKTAHDYFMLLRCNLLLTMNAPNIQMLILTDIDNKAFHSYIECILLINMMLMYVIAKGISVIFDCQSVVSMWGFAGSQPISKDK